jgi:glycine cleavage system aminomethyltransferase T
VVFYIGGTIFLLRKISIKQGLNFAISYKKPFDFIGKEKLLKIRDEKLDRRFVMLALKEVNLENHFYFMRSQYIWMIKSLGKQHQEITHLITVKNLSFWLY